MKSVKDGTSMSSVQRKRWLLWVTTSLGVVGSVMLAMVLLGSMQPTPRAEAALPRVDIADLQPGQLMTAALYPHDWFDGYRWSVLLYRQADGSVKAWELPTKAGKVGMPDLRWWRPMYLCEDFGLAPDHLSDDQSVVIQCNDTNEAVSWWKPHWRWDVDGKNLGTMVDDLIPAKGIVEGDFFVYGLSDK